MRRLAFLSAFLVASTALAGPWDDIVKYGYAVSGGPLTGAMGSAVCEQVDDDTTPSIGTPPASLPDGCNVLLTSTNHSGPISITRFDDAESGVEPVTSTLFEQILWVVGRAATNQTTIADGANFRLKEIPWDSPATGDHSVIQFKATYLTSSITAVGNGGGGTSLDITSTAHGLVMGQTVTLSLMTIPAYDGTYVINTVADPNTFNVTQTHSGTATGTWDAIRFDEMWRSGNVDDYYYQQIFVNEGNITDFVNAQVVVGQADTGQTSITDRIGLVGEAASDGSDESRGLAGYAKTSSAEDATGVLGIAFVNAGSDTKTAYGGIFASADTHGSGSNVGAFCTASSGLTNYCLQLQVGDINSLAAINWLGLDNSASMVSWDAAGAADMLLISSLDGEETVALTAKGTITSALDAASGDEYALDIAYTTNKATSGDDYGIRLRKTHTASPGSSYLLDIGLATTSLFNVQDTGDTTHDSGAAATLTAAYLYNTTERGELLATATNFEVKGYGTIPPLFHSEDLSSAAGTAAVSMYTGAQSHIGDHNSGPLNLYTGTTATLGDSGAMGLGTGNAADTSGPLDLSTGTSANTAEVSGAQSRSTGNQTHATGGVSGSITDSTGTAAGTAATGGYISYTGDQTNTGDFPSGSYTWTTGDTTTAGTTGSQTHTTGIAGAGAAFAGSHIWQTHGANTRMTLKGDGSELLMGTGVDVDVNDNNVVNPDMLYIEPRSSDVAALDVHMRSGSAYSQATINPAGAPGYINGGIGAKSIAVVQATAAGSTLSFLVDDTTTTITMVAGAPGANEVQCITSNNVCATALETYLDSNITGITATAVAAAVWLDPAVTTRSLGLTSADGTGTKFVVADGADGAVNVAGVQLYSDWSTARIGAGSAGSTALRLLGTSVLVRNVADTTNTPLYASTLRVDAVGSFYYDTRTRCTSPVDGNWICGNNAATQGVLFDTATTADVLGLSDESGNGITLNLLGSAAAIQFNSSADRRIRVAADHVMFEAGQGLILHMEEDADGDGDAMLSISAPDSNSFKGAAGETQYGSYMTPIIEQTVTAAFIANFIDVTDTSSGSVQDYLADWKWGTVTQFSVEDDGDGYFAGLLTLGGGLAMGGDLDMNDNAILNPLAGIYGEAPTADTDPDDILFHAEHSFSSGSQTAANLLLAGGLGDGYVFESTDWANSTDDELTIIVGHCAAGVCATLGTVTLTESIHWDCDLTGNNECACALYTYLAANLPTGIASVSRTDGTCSDSKVFLQPEDEGTYSLVLAAQDTGGGGVWGTAANGANGQILIPDGAVGAPAWAFASDPTTGGYTDATGRINFGTGGAVRLRIYGSTITSYGDLISAGRIYDNGGALALGNAYNAGAGAEGIVTGGVIIGKDAANKSLDVEGSAYINGILYADGSAVIADAQLLGFGGTSNSYIRGRADIDQLHLALNAAEGRQLVIGGGLNLDYDHPVPTDQTVFLHNDTSPTTDNGYYVGWSYDGMRSGTPETDRAANKFDLMAGNAWAQAGVGATRNGANVNIASGIRTLALVCTDRTISDQDSIVFTVDGVAQAALVESTDFNCDGTGSEEVCCDNLGAAIVTADYGITPDCDTTAGTCYLTPNDDLLTVDDIVITDFGGGAGFTLTEGTDGSVNIHTAHNAMVVGPTGVTIDANLTIGELLYLDDDGDSYITGTNTDDVIELYSAVAGGTGYTAILSPNGAGYLAVGDTGASEPSRLSIVDGGDDNEAGELVLYDDSGTGHFIWVNTADVLRGNNAEPADDDAGGYAIMSLADGTIGASTQAGTFAALTTNGLRVRTAAGDAVYLAAASITVTHETHRVAGDGAARTLTSQPNIEDAALDNTCVTLQGTSEANTLTIQDEGTLANSGLVLSGAVNFTLGNRDTITLCYDSGEDLWIEHARTDVNGA